MRTQILAIIFFLLTTFSGAALAASKEECDKVREDKNPELLASELMKECEKEFPAKEEPAKDADSEFPKKTEAKKKSNLFLLEIDYCVNSMGYGVEIPTETKDACVNLLSWRQENPEKDERDYVREKCPETEKALCDEALAKFAAREDSIDAQVKAQDYIYPQKFTPENPWSRGITFKVKSGGEKWQDQESILLIYNNGAVLSPEILKHEAKQATKVHSQDVYFQYDFDTSFAERFGLFVGAENKTIIARTTVRNQNKILYDRTMVPSSGIDELSASRLEEMLADEKFSAAGATENHSSLDSFSHSLLNLGIATEFEFGYANVAYEKITGKQNYRYSFDRTTQTVCQTKDCPAYGEEYQYSRGFGSPGSFDAERGSFSGTHSPLDYSGSKIAYEFGAKYQGFKLGIFQKTFAPILVPATLGPGDRESPDLIEKRSSFSGAGLSLGFESSELSISARYYSLENNGGIFADSTLAYFPETGTCSSYCYTESVSKAQKTKTSGNFDYNILFQPNRFGLILGASHQKQERKGIRGDIHGVLLNDYKNDSLSLESNEKRIGLRFCFYSNVCASLQQRTHEMKLERSFWKEFSNDRPDYPGEAPGTGKKISEKADKINRASQSSFTESWDAKQVFKPKSDYLISFDAEI